MNTQWVETCEIKEPVFIISGMSTYGERMVSDSAAEQGFRPKRTCLSGHWAPSRTFRP